MSGTLVASGLSKIGRPELAQIAVPEATSTHKPVPHHTIVEALVETLSFRHIGVVQEEYAVSPDGAKMFGVLDLETQMEGCRFSIGIRNSHDKSIRLGLTAGLRVFVCSNMAFSGDFTPVLAKHTKSFNLIDTLSVGVDRIQRNFEPLQCQVELWRKTQITDDTARLIFYSAFIDGKLEALCNSMTFLKNCIPMTGMERQSRTSFPITASWTRSNISIPFAMLISPTPHAAASGNAVSAECLSWRATNGTRNRSAQSSEG
jgi:hypothetical protein